jgi:predicted NBD/HSP70 family sugar kinase
MNVLTELAERLGGPMSPVRGRTQARVMRALCQQIGDGARDLAQTLEVSAGTVSKAVAQLKLAKLVQQEPARARGPGRPITPLHWTRNYVMIGVAIAGRIVEWPGKEVPDAMVGTVIAPDGAPFPGIEKTRQRVQLTEAAHTDFGLFMDELEKYIRELAAIPLRAGAKVLGCGVTVCGHVDHKRGVVRKFYSTLWDASPSHMEAPDELCLTRELEKRLGMTIVLDNDVTSLAVRANLRPPPNDEPDKYYILLAVLNDGIGGAVVLDGSTWRGADGMAAEPGHLPVKHVATIRLEVGAVGTGLHPAAPGQPVHISEGMATATADMDTPSCRCGEKGHVEAFAAPRAIISRAKAKGLAGNRLASIDELAARPWTETKLAELFLQGGIALGRTVSAAINWINPQRILVYLPSALYEPNRYLAGSFYLIGLRREIQASAFSAGRNTPLQIIRTSSAEMEGRLATAAAYLVFAELTDRTEAVGKKNRSGEGTGLSRRSRAG